MLVRDLPPPLSAEMAGRRLRSFASTASPQTRFEVTEVAALTGDVVDEVLDRSAVGKRRAADVLAGLRDLVVVVGAAAIEVALSGTGVAITPTRDVDVVVPVAEAAAIVSALEADGLRRSEAVSQRQAETRVALRALEAR